MERFRNYYQQVDSNMIEIEINMHGNPLVIMSAYIPHDGVHEDSRLKKAPREKAAFKLVGSQGNREPWTTDRFAVLDLRL
eukprot:6196346-Heterocapsa_arctica.AAC.1